MFERFTAGAHAVVALAEEEAGMAAHEQISSQDVLLGLLRTKSTSAASVLHLHGVTLERVRQHVPGSEDEGEGRIAYGDRALTPRAGAVLDLALREALSLGHNYIGVDHILLALLREDESAGARILLDCETDLETIRESVIRQLPAREYPGPTLAPRGAKHPLSWSEALRETRGRYGLVDC